MLGAFPALLLRLRLAIVRRPFRRPVVQPGFGSTAGGQVVEVQE